MNRLERDPTVILSSSSEDDELLDRNQRPRLTHEVDLGDVAFYRGMMENDKRHKRKHNSFQATPSAMDNESAVEDVREAERRKQVENISRPNSVKSFVGGSRPRPSITRDIYAILASWKHRHKQKSVKCRPTGSDQWYEPRCVCFPFKMC